MLWEFIKEDKVLTATIIVISVLWIIIFMRNLWIGKKTSWEFQKTYEHILKADEFKVKAKYE